MKELEATAPTKESDSLSEKEIYDRLKFRLEYSWTYQQLVTLMLKIDTMFKPFENKVTDSEYKNRSDTVAKNFLEQVKGYATCLVTIRNSMQVINAQLAVNREERVTADDSKSATPDLKGLRELIQQPQLPIQPLLWGNILIMWTRCWHALGAAAHAYDNCVEEQVRIYQKAIFDCKQEMETLGDTTAKILNPRNLKTRELREQIVALRNRINEYKQYSGEAPSFWGKPGTDPKTKNPYPNEPNTFDFIVYLSAFLTEIAEEKRVRVAHSESLGVHSWEEIFSQLDAWNGKATTEKSDILARIDDSKKLDIAKEKLVITQYIENSSFSKLSERLKGKEDKVYDYCYTAAAGSARLDSVIAKLQDFHDYFVLQSTGGSDGHDPLKWVIMELNIVMRSLRQYANEANKIAENLQKFIDEYNLKLENMQSAPTITKRKREIINTLQKLAEIFVPVIIDKLPTPKKIVPACTTAELAKRHDLDNQWSELVSSMLKMEEKKYTWPEKIEELNIAIDTSQEISIGLSPMRAVFMQLLEKNITIVRRAVEAMEKNFNRLRSRPQINALIFRDLLTQWQTEAKSMVIHIEGVGNLVTTPLYRVQEAIIRFNGQFTGDLFPGFRENSYIQAKRYTQWLAEYLKRLTSPSHSVSNIMKELSVWVDQINEEIFKKFSPDRSFISRITRVENKPLVEAKKIENILKLKSYLMAQQDKKFDEKSVESTSVNSTDRFYKRLADIYKQIYQNSQYSAGLDELINKRLTELLNATMGVQKAVFLLLSFVYGAQGVIKFEGDLYLYKKIILACQGKSLVEKRFNLTRIISEQSIELLRQNSPKKEPPDIFLAPLITVAEKLYILHDKMHEALLDNYETAMEFSELNCQMTQVTKKLQAGIGPVSESSPSSLSALFELWRGAIHSKVNISDTELRASHLDVELKYSNRQKSTLPGECKVIKMKLWPSICRHFLPLLSFEELAEGILFRLRLKTASSTLSSLTSSPVSPQFKQKTSFLDTLDAKAALELDYTEEMDSRILVEFLKLGVEENPVGRESVTKLVSSRAQVFLQVWFDPALHIVRESLQTFVLAEMKSHTLSAAKRAVLNFALEAPFHILMSPHKGAQPIHFCRFSSQPKITSIWTAGFMALQTIADEKQLFFGDIPHVVALQLKIVGDQFGQGKIEDMSDVDIFKNMAAELKINICLYQEPALELTPGKIDGEEEEDSKSIFKLSSIKLRKFGESRAIQSIYLYRDQQGYCYPLLPTAELVQKPEQVLRLQKLSATVFSAMPVELSSSRSSSSSSLSSSSYSFNIFSSSTASIASDSALVSSSRASSSLSSMSSG